MRAPVANPRGRPCAGEARSGRAQPARPVVSARKTAKAVPIASIEAMNNKAMRSRNGCATEMAANSRTTTRQVSSADSTDMPVAKLISCIRRSSDPQFRDPAVVLLATAGEQQWLDRPRAVDDPRQARGADVEEGADAAQQEHRRDREPNHVGDFGHRDVGYSNMDRHQSGERSQLATSSSIRPFTTKLAASTQAKLAIRLGRAEQADNDGRDRQAGGQQHRERNPSPRR